MMNLMSYIFEGKNNETAPLQYISIELQSKHAHLQNSKITLFFLYPFNFLNQIRLKIEVCLKAVLVQFYEQFNLIFMI